MSCLFRVARELVFCIVVLSLTGLAEAKPARGDDLATREVRLFSESSFSGASVAVRLPPGTPFLLMPELEPALSNNVGSLKVGAEVGLLLFAFPNFINRDKGCAPKLGTDKEPTLWWRGETADAFLAAPDSRSEALLVPGGLPNRYASLIVFSRETGPPPSLLLLERRSHYDHSCGDELYASHFNRMVVPIPAPPEGTHCLDLGAAVGGGNRQVMDPPRMERTEEAFLLTADRLDHRYAGAPEHQARFLLFDREECDGNSIAFSSQLNSGERGMRLSDLGFQHAARSVEAIYETGPWRQHYDSDSDPGFPAGEPQPQAAGLDQGSAQAQQPTASQEAAGFERIAPPSESAASSPDTDSTATPLPLPAEALARPSYLNSDDDAVTLQPALPPPPEFIDLPKEPETFSPSLEEEAGTTGYSLQSFGQESGEDDIFADAPQAQVVVPQVVVPQVAGPTLEGLSETTQGDEADFQLAPVLPSEAAGDQTAATLAPDPENEDRESSLKTFRYPVHAGYRLNYCYRRENGECGEAAAQAWCKTKGYKEAVSWKRELHIGALFPTIVMGEDTICDKYLCDGFEEVTCATE